MLQVVIHQKCPVRVPVCVCLCLGADSLAKLEQGAGYYMETVATLFRPAGMLHKCCITSLTCNMNIHFALCQSIARTDLGYRCFASAALRQLQLSHVAAAASAASAAADVVVLYRNLHLNLWRQRRC